MLEAILARAQKNNGTRGITGMLCHYDGSFLQFLEGKEADLTEVFAKIRADERHHDILEVYRRPIKERLFPDWTMALVKVDDVSPEQRVFCKGLRSVELAAAAEHKRALEPFLDTFRAWMR
jgi:hypothetical protein